MNAVIPFSKLQKSSIGWEFEGYKFNDTALTFVIVDALPGEEVRLHMHPYTEVFIVLEGKVKFNLGNRIIEAESKEIVIVPPNVPHKFINIGQHNLRQVDIHLNARFSTKWLEE
jgi:mannose-6-phosphate isomerase-like protein (cupin superfamily)